MSERKHKHAPDDAVEFNAEETGIVLEPAQVELGAGYSLAVSYDKEEKLVIDVKTFGQVDMTKLRREIRRCFPEALIRQANPCRTVTVARKGKRRPGGRKK
jgi:hypothetical protein